MGLFWQRGYRGVSIRDIAAETGVLPGSLHHCYGGKRELFLEALRHYDCEHREKPLAELAKLPSPRKAISEVFERAVAQVLDEGSRDGCLTVNAALELGAHDCEVADIAARAFRGMEEFLRGCIERGQDLGEIPAHVDAVETSRELLAMFLGIRVLSRTRPQEAVLRSIARTAVAMLS